MDDARVDARAQSARSSLFRVLAFYRLAVPAWAEDFIPGRSNRLHVMGRPAAHRFGVSIGLKMPDQDVGATVILACVKPYGAFRHGPTLSLAERQLPGTSTTARPGPTPLPGRDFYSAAWAERAPSDRNHSITFSCRVPRPVAASNAVPCAYSGSQFRSAPAFNKRSAARR